MDGRLSCANRTYKWEPRKVCMLQWIIPFYIANPYGAIHCALPSLANAVGTIGVA